MTTLEKIRAEIEQVEINGYIRDVECFRAGINTALNIIDKYAEQEPCTDAQERYEDLCEYFGDAKDILKSRKDFKAWLDRIKWHIHKAEELYEKYEHKQEPCDDAIDRAGAMTEIMMFAGNVKSDEEDVYIKVSDAVQLLRELPSVRPQEPTGKWIEHHNQTRFYFKCSNCKTLHDEKSNYYPFCGKRMEGDYKGLTKIVIGENDVI